jgi:hypothetical protein
MTEPVPRLAPRPALVTGADGVVRPALPHQSALSVELGRDPGKAKKDKDREVVELAVEVPRSVRKALRRRAEEYGWTAEEAAAHVLRVWSEG